MEQRQSYEGTLVLVPVAIIGAAAERDMRLGCVGMLLLPLAQVFATLSVLWILLPIILGTANEALWGMPFQIALQSPWWMLKVVAGLTFMVVLAAFVPIVGRSGTFANFVVGSFALAIATRAFVEGSGRQDLARIQYFPGFWMFVGFLIIGGIVSTGGGIAVAGLSMLANRRAGQGEDATPGPIVASAVGILGLVPCFIYGAWLGLQIKGATP